ncbi:CDK5 and ABL1 enzyme substrate 2-like isoform X3 [Clavelina lepadiformis]|uniref:CDK5 and ABL1 enzyme substrate 2-like isoform X3 n=1 Tax=Clavelina lepadiformis TaxID=159417 RepID=UPI0040421269
MDEHTERAALFYLAYIPLDLNSAEELIKEYSSEQMHSGTSGNASVCDNKNNHHDSEEIGNMDPSLPQSRVLYKRSLSTIDKTSENTNCLIRRSSLSSIAETILPPVQALYCVRRSQLRNRVEKIKYITNKSLRKSRAFLVEPSHHTLLAVFSVIPYVKDGNKSKSQGSPSKGPLLSHTRLEQLENLTLPEPTQVVGHSKEEVSYNALLHPSFNDLAPVNLNSPQWTCGKHRRVLRFNSYIVSIVDYTKPSELKRDLNLKFKKCYPQVCLTLSKLRSLEKQMMRSVKAFGLQPAVLTYAKYYFERLVFSCAINKANRHHLAAVCLLLSAKVHGDLKTEVVPELISILEHYFKANCSAFLPYEFAAFAALKFSLIFPIRNRHLSDES